MRNTRIRAKQHGVILVVGLLLLLAMTLVAVASMGASHMQERMAGNHRTQALAFEAASIGAAGAVQYYIDKRDAGELPGLCRLADSNPWPPTAPDTMDAIDLGLPAGTQLRRSVACVAQQNPACNEELVDPLADCPDFRPQLLVLNQGRVIVDNQTVAQREVEVRIDYLLPPGDPITGCSGICLPGCNWTDPPRLANSNQFVVDGGAYGDPAVTVGCQPFADALIDVAEENGRLGNYSWQGEGTGIKASEIGPPWGSIETMLEFAAFVKEEAQAIEPGAGCSDGRGANKNGPCYYDGNFDESGNYRLGTPTSPRFTYIDGNATVSGAASGAGIMVVNGNLTWGGTPDYKGLILVLGGSFSINGGGGGDTNGSIIVANALNPTADNNFGTATLDIAGGGNHKIQFDCDLLISHWKTLLNSDSRWEPECGPGDASGPDAKGPPEPSITSWRESLGWRRDQLWDALTTN